MNDSEDRSFVRSVGRRGRRLLSAKTSEMAQVFLLKSFPLVPGGGGGEGGGTEEGRKEERGFPLPRDARLVPDLAAIFPRRRSHCSRVSTRCFFALQFMKQLHRSK